MSSATLFEVSLYGLIADSSTTSSAVSRLRSLLDRCVGLCNAVNGEMNSVSGLPRKSLFEHHIAYIPARKERGSF